MKSILVTGAYGFVGKNIIAELSMNKDLSILEADIDTEQSDFESFLLQADFVIHTAGVNRVKDDSEFFKGNSELSEWIIGTLKSRKDFHPPVLITSSIQSDLNNSYGKSKRLAEKAVLEYGSSMNVPVYVFKLPNLFGKWSRANYNSVVSTFCHNIANDMPIRIDDPSKELTLCYIDDLLALIKSAVDGKLKPGEDGYCEVKTTYTVTLQNLADMIYRFHSSRDNLLLPSLEGLEKKLYSTYLSYLPKEKFSYSLTPHSDNRGSFFEFLKTDNHGQLSVSTTVPGITRGNHWHHTKVEKFFVVSGEASIKLRKIDEKDITEYTVSSANPVVVDIPPGYTHSITNTSKTEMLITIIWANELFDSENPDTFYEEV